MDDDPGIVAVPLAVGLTRPSLKFGVPYEALVLNLMVSVLALVLSQNLVWLAICLPIHAVCYLVCLKDPRTFELLLLWIITTLRTLVITRHYWSASSYSPLSLPPRPVTRFQVWQIRARQRLLSLLEKRHDN